MSKDYNKVEPKAVAKVVEEVEVEEVVEKRPTSVVKKAPKKAKKGLVERGVAALIGPDGLPAVGRFVVKDVIGPALKDLFVNSIVSGVQMFAYRDGNAPRTPYNGRTQSFNSPRKVDYGSRYGQPRTQSKPSNNGPWNDYGNPGNNGQRLITGSVLNDWAIPDRDDAMKVITAMNEIAYNYGQVKVRDYYDLIGVETVYTDNNYGWLWDDIQGLRIRTTRDGFVLDLPPVREMK